MSSLELRRWIAANLEPLVTDAMAVREAAQAAALDAPAGHRSLRDYDYASGRHEGLKAAADALQGLVRDLQFSESADRRTDAGLVRRGPASVLRVSA